MPIDEYLVVGNRIYPASTSSKLLELVDEQKPADSSSMPPLRTVNESKFKELTDNVVNAVVALAVETASAGYGALVFCRSRQRSQITALLVSRAMPGQKLISDDLVEKRKEIISELRNLPVGIDETLAKTIMNGVAFHRTSAR